MIIDEEDSKSFMNGGRGMRTHLHSGVLKRCKCSKLSAHAYDRILKVARRKTNPQSKTLPELRNDSFVKMYYAICLLFFPTSHQNQNKQTASATIIRPCAHSEIPALVAPTMPTISTTW